VVSYIRPCKFAILTNSERKECVAMKVIGQLEIERFEVMAVSEEFLEIILE
jgi:hypothetical protein